MNTISIVKFIYRSILPEKLRENKCVTKIKDFFGEKLFGHNAIYDKDFYEEDVEIPANNSAAIISNSIIKTFNPKSVIDVGCGTGALLFQLQNDGCQVVGLEYSEAGLQYCRERNVRAIKFNIEKDTFSFDKFGRFDVAISMEVAEHLAAIFADRYIELLTTLSSVVIFTAATPGQGGTDHVNEQPHSYWITKFQQQSFIFDEELTILWRLQWEKSGSVAGWYYRNLMIFRRHD